MPRAIWNGVVVAESDDTVIVEGNHYFPLADIKREYFAETTHSSICSWKGRAGYYTLTVNGKENPNAAWIYRNPKPAAAEMKDRVAFWHGVRVEDG